MSPPERGHHRDRRPHCAPRLSSEAVSPPPRAGGATSSRGAGAMSSRAGRGPGAALRGGAAAHQGPGDLTLTSIVLFTLGAYGVAAGAATGQEAVVAVGIFAFTLFLVGIVWPVWSLARVEVDVVAPTDAVVGDPVELRLVIRGRAARVDVRALDPSGVWWRTAAPADGKLAHIAARRGVFRTVRVQLRTSAPLGVFVRTRTLRVRWPLRSSSLPGPRSRRRAATDTRRACLERDSVAGRRGGGHRPNRAAVLAGRPRSPRPLADERGGAASSSCANTNRLRHWGSPSSSTSGAPPPKPPQASRPGSAGATFAAGARSGVARSRPASPSGAGGRRPFARSAARPRRPPVRPRSRPPDGPRKSCA